MVDQRAKNIVPDYLRTDPLVCIFYDNETCAGLNK